MKLPRDLSGRALVAILTNRFGYRAVDGRYAVDPSDTASVGSGWNA